ncbi:MAG: acyl-ACP desaturase [Nocardioidaceae bacterium]
MSQTDLTQTELLLELEPVVEENLNRHIRTWHKEWFPHEYIPWSEGRNFDGHLERRAVVDRGQRDLRRRPFGADRQPAHRGQPAELPPRDRRRCSAATPPGATGCTGGPPRRGGTAYAIRDYLLVTRAVDPVELERAADAPHVDRATQSAHTDDLLALAGVRLLPGARDPRVAPQHRPSAPATRSPTSCWRGSRSMRTCT